MISPRSLLVALTYGSAVFAVPGLLQYSHGTLVMDKAGYAHPDSNIAGAAYFVTNEPSGNYVVAAALSSDGKLSYNRAVSTKGTGARGNNLLSPTDPDAIFSQSAVAASSASRILAAVNPGSNTLTAFSINPKNPVDIKPIGSPVPSGGEFPNSVAFNKDGTQVCVLNTGHVNGVNCYKVDKDSGLTVIPDTVRSLGLNQTTPATGPPGSASQIIFSEDQTKLVVSVKGVPPTPGFLAVWDVAANGSLSEDFTRIAAPEGAVLPFSMTLIPGQNAIFTTDPGVGFEIYDFAGAGTGPNATAGPRTAAIPVEGQMLSCWSARSNKTGNYYIADLATSIITEAQVDENLKGSVVKQYQQKQLSATMDIDIASFNGNDYLYILQPNITSVHVLDLTAPGEALNLGTYSLASAAKAAGLKIDRSFMQGMVTFKTQN